MLQLNVYLSYMFYMKVMQQSVVPHGYLVFSSGHETNTLTVAGQNVIMFKWLVEIRSSWSCLYFPDWPVTLFARMSN